LTPRRKKLLIAFISVVGLVSGFLVIEHFRGVWALNGWKARMVAKGEELSIDKLTPKVPSADENGMPQLLWVAGQLGPFPVDLLPPVARYAAPGKWVTVTRMNDWRFQNARRTNVAWVEIAENLAISESRIEACLEALQSTTFNANLYYRGGINNLSVNHLARIKSLAQFLSTAALHDLHQHQAEAAFRNLRGLLAVPNVLKDEPTVISQLVRIASMHIAMSATWQALQCGGWSDSQLAALQDAWGAYDFLSGMDKAFAMERAMASIEIERIRSSDLPFSAFFDQSGVVAPAPTPSLLSWDWVGQMFDPRERIFAPLWKFAWSAQDELHYCETMQAVLEVHRIGQRSRSGLPVIAGIEKIESVPMNPYDYPRFIISRLVISAVAKTMTRAWVAQTSAEIAKTAIAIKRYELRERRLPCSLAVLAPDFLSEIPVDYMDGKPLRYCLDSDSAFILYSVGLDGRDGHGDASSTASSLNYQNTRDLVWPRVASEIDVLSWQASRR
jgi:hypothetical protein